jgi:hypothetical protein
LKVKETTHSILNTVSGAACPDEIGDHGFCNLLLIKFSIATKSAVQPYPDTKTVSSNIIPFHKLNQSNPPVKVLAVYSLRLIPFR